MKLFNLIFLVPAESGGGQAQRMQVVCDDRPRRSVLPDRLQARVPTRRPPVCQSLRGRRWTIQDGIVSHAFHVLPSGYPRHRENTENRENGKKKSLSGKTQGIGEFCKNTGKTQGIWFAQGVNSLILKVKNISGFAAKISFFRRTWIRQFCVCNSHKSRKLAQGKFTVRQGKHRENTGNSKNAI